MPQYVILNIIVSISKQPAAQIEGYGLGDTITRRIQPPGTWRLACLHSIERSKRTAARPRCADRKSHHFKQINDEFGPKRRPSPEGFVSLIKSRSRSYGPASRFRIGGRGVSPLFSPTPEGRTRYRRRAFCVRARLFRLARQRRVTVSIGVSECRLPGSLDPGSSAPTDRYMSTLTGPKSGRVRPNLFRSFR